MRQKYDEEYSTRVCWYIMYINYFVRSCSAHSPTTADTKCEQVHCTCKFIFDQVCVDSVSIVCVRNFVFHGNNWGRCVSKSARMFCVSHCAISTWKSSRSDLHHRGSAACMSCTKRAVPAAYTRASDVSVTKSNPLPACHRTSNVT